MNDLNAVLLTGRLTRDPDTKETSAGAAVTSFAIAVNRYSKLDSGDWRQETSYLEIETWGLLAKQCAEIPKGQVVRIQGRIKQERWQDGDGANRTKVLVIAERVEWRRPRTEEPEAPAAGRID